MENIEPNFLQKVASDIIDAKPDFEKTIVLFPSIRSLSYFKDHFLKQRTQAGIMPECITISSFIEKLSAVSKTDSVHQSIALEQLIQKHCPELPMQFIESVVPKVVADLSELAMFGIPFEKAFQKAAEIYRIDTWGKEDYEAKFHEQYLRLCLKLPEIEQEFLKHFSQKGYYSNAGRIDKSIERIHSLEAYNNLFVVGFAVLTPKEQELFKACGEKLKLHFFWKVHDWYVSDERNEAGRFYRALPELFKRDSNKALSFSDPEIDYAAFGSNAESILYTVKRLQNDIREDAGTKSYAIVLGDEAVAPLLLHYLSSMLSSVNVSVALPAEYSPLLKELLTYSRKVFKTDSSADELYKKVSTFIEDWSPLDVSEAEERLLIKQSETLLQAINSFEKEKELKEEYFSNWYRFSSFVRKHGLNVKGDKGAAVQVFGLLESRNLDFDRVYVLNFNEGNIQGKLQNNSLLPFSIRAQLGLPLSEEKESVFSYYFFSLISSSDSVFISYINSSSGVVSDEKSRLLQQIIFEQNFTKVRELEIDVKLEAPKEDQIVRDDHFPEEIKALFEKGLSPSAVNKFIMNPLEFYYRYLWRINELSINDPQEDASLLGTLVHKCLEDLYKDYIGVLIGEEEIDCIIKFWKEKYESIIVDAKELKGRTLAPYLILHIRNAVADYLQSDKLRLLKDGKITILFLEKKLSVDLNFNGQKLHLKGTIDRIEEQNGLLRLIDYKTGNVQARDLKVSTEKDIEGIWEDSKKDKVRQLLFYNYLVSHSEDLNGYDNTELTIDTLFSIRPERYKLENSTEIDIFTTKYFENELFNLLVQLLNNTEIFQPDYQIR